MNLMEIAIQINSYETLLTVAPFHNNFLLSLYTSIEHCASRT